MKTSDPKLTAIVLALTESQDELHRYIFLRLGNDDVARDVLQETNLAIWKDIDRLDAPENFLPWAKALASFEIRRYLTDRKRENAKLVFDSETVETLAETLQTPEAEAAKYDEVDFQALNACIAKLPPEKRRLVNRRYWDDKTVESIAREDAAPFSTVAVRLLRIRKELNACIRHFLCRIGRDKDSGPAPGEAPRAELIGRILDGDLSRMPEMCAELRRDPEFRREWFITAAIHLALVEDAAHVPSPPVSAQSSDPLATRHMQQHGRTKWWATGIAAGILLFVGFGWAAIRLTTSPSAPAPEATAPVTAALIPAVPAEEEPAAVITAAIARAAVPLRLSAPIVTSAPPAEITASATIVTDAVVSVKTLTEKKVEEGVVTNMNKLTASVSAAVVAVAFTASASDTAWLNAIDDDWNIAANWTLGVPTRDTPAFLTNTAASYTVSLTNRNVTTVITNLTVLNTGANTTTLVIGSALTANSGLLNFGTGARINLVTNGVLDCLDAATNHVSGRTQLQLAGGAELQIDGGTLLATNQTSHFVLGNTSGSAVSRLIMTSGSMCFTNKGNFKMYENLAINQGGSLEASGGFIGAKTLPDYESAFQLTKGTINLSGDAVLLLTNNWSHDWSGDLTLSEYASASFGNLNFIGRTDWTNHIALSGNASLSIGKADDGSFQIGSLANSTGTGATYVSVQDQASLTLQSKLGIGLSQGYGEMEIGGGTVACAVCWVGCATHYPTYGSSTGLVEMTGGTLYSSGGNTLNNYYEMVEKSHSSAGIPFVGFIVGANVNAVAAPGVTLGMFNFSGGTISNDVGRILIGTGATACGRFVQTGGAFHQTYRSNNGAFNALGNSTIIGACGGDGAYIISNGTFNTDWHVCVGGLSTNEWYADVKNAGIPAQSLMVARGTGLLDIEGGAFTIKTNQADLIIGACGSGTVKIGPAGTCLAQNIILTNGADAAISCTLGADGLGTLQAAKKLTIYGGAKLSVDATAYMGRESWIPLIRCASREGSFEASNILVQDGKGTVVQNHDSTGTVYLHIPHGTVFTLGGGI